MYGVLRVLLFALYALQYNQKQLIAHVCASCTCICSIHNTYSLVGDSNSATTTETKTDTKFGTADTDVCLNIYKYIYCTANCLYLVMHLYVNVAVVCHKITTFDENITTQFSMHNDLLLRIVCVLFELWQQQLT